MTHGPSSEGGRFVETAGIATHYHEAGAGPPVVLIHGSGPGVCAYATWRRSIPALSRHHRVLAPDLIGFGLTERRRDQTYGRDAWLAHLEAFADAVGAGAASLVGNSLGGALAITLAERRPDRVPRLALVSAPVVSFPVTDGLRTIWGYKPGRSAMRRVLETLAYDKRLVTDEVVESRYLASIESGAYEAFATMFPPPYQRWVDAFAVPDDQLSALSQPTLVVHGRQDRV
ncbi:MAG: alpha/beta fold hydrolase, partial [Actinomycetota bacterium]